MTVDNPSSAEQSESRRASLESRYAGVLAPEVDKFMRQVMAWASAGTLSIVAVNNAWGDLTDRVAGKVQSPALIQFLAASEIPATAMVSAQFYLDRARALNMTSAETSWLLATALGFSDDPFPGLGGELGRIVTPDDSLSWDKAAEGISRGASTGDHASAMILQLREEGYPYKRWYDMNDSRVRPTHQAADRQTILLDEEFAVGNARLRFPGDPMGPPEETHGCRCVLAGTRTKSFR